MGKEKMKNLLITEEAWEQLSAEKMIIGPGKMETFSETILRLIAGRVEAAKK